MSNNDTALEPASILGSLRDAHSPHAESVPAEDSDELGEPEGAIYGEGGDTLPPGASYVVLGGVERSVGAWSTYEVGRRAIGGAAEEKLYPRRTYIGADDVVESLLNARGRVGGGCSCPYRTPLGASTKRLAAAMEAFEERTRKPGWWGQGTDYVVAPPVTSAGLSELRDQQTDQARLKETSEDVRVLCASLPSNEALERQWADMKDREGRLDAQQRALPRRNVSTSDAAGVRRLEASCAPYAAALEDYQARLAAFFETAADLLEQASSK